MDEPDISFVVLTVPYADAGIAARDKDTDAPRSELPLDAVGGYLHEPGDEYAGYFKCTRSSRRGQYDDLFHTCHSYAPHLIRVYHCPQTGVHKAQVSRV